MIVIIEGPDGAGKTQLARHLAEEYHLHYHHEGPPPAGADVFKHYADLLDGALERPTVFDRFALGERVYGPVLRGKDGFTDERWDTFTKLLKLHGAQTILCLPSYITCHTNWSSGRPEMFDNADLFFQAYQRWAMLAMTERSIDHIYNYVISPIPYLITD